LFYLLQYITNLRIFTGRCNGILYWVRIISVSLLSLKRFQYPSRLAGVISCSGYVLSALKSVNEANKDTPLIAYHGTADEMVPLIYAKTTYYHLKRNHNIKVTFVQEEDQQHELTRKVVNELMANFVNLLEL
jgi:predicted esterase